MTLEQARAMTPLLDFAARYDTPDWTAEQFAAAVYRAGDCRQRAVRRALRRWVR